MICKSYLVEGENQLLKTTPAYLFYGENVGLKKDFKNKIIEENSGSQFVNLNQDEILKKDSVLESFLTDSLFGEKKVIFIDEASDRILDKISEIIKKIDNHKIVIFANVLDKKSKLRSFFEKSNALKAVACYPDNELSIKKVIQNRLKNYSGLTNYTLNLILDSSNLDRVKLNNELSKIETFFIDKIINDKKLEKILDAKVNENFNILRDKAFEGNKIITNNLLSETVIDDDKVVYYLNLINQRLIKLKEIVKNRKEGNLENTINNIKPPIFWKDKPSMIIQAQKWDMLKINHILEMNQNIEIKIKSISEINKRVLIKKLIIDICELANA